MNNNNKNKKSNKRKAQKSATLESIRLTNLEATLVYELMHDVKTTYMNMNEDERSKQKAKDMIRVCNGIMKKVERLILGDGTGEGKSQNDKKGK